MSFDASVAFREVVSLVTRQSSGVETGTVDAMVRAEIEAIAEMIESEAEATIWPEEADRLRIIAKRVRERIAPASEPES